MLVLKNGFKLGLVKSTQCAKKLCADKKPQKARVVCRKVGGSRVSLLCLKLFNSLISLWTRLSGDVLHTKTKKLPP